MLKQDKQVSSLGIRFRLNASLQGRIRQTWVLITGQPILNDRKTTSKHMILRPHTESQPGPPQFLKNRNLICPSQTLTGTVDIIKFSMEVLMGYSYK